MYQIKCDDYILYDPRDDELVVMNPRCTLEVNKVGSASFTILPTHPYYGHLKKLKSVIQIKQDNDIIFRGRMTEDSRDFKNMLDVDVEGVLAYANDSIIPPFNFPEDFAEADSAENVVACLLGWVLEQHNAQVESWQRLKLGRVTVADPNNYITRSSSDYASTWDTLKSKLFDSALGGYLSVRYEADGNYIDYLADFELTNTQRLVYGENLQDIKQKSDATKTYSAIFPQGAESEREDGTKYILTIEDLPDGDLTEDLVKEGKFIYSRSARAEHGWICVPPNDSRFSDVTVASNLQAKAVEQLSGEAMWLTSTITFKAVDLHYSDKDIQTFRHGRYVLVDAPLHGVDGARFLLTKLSIDILKPQNTTITVGETVRTMLDVNDKQHSDTIQRVETVKKDIAENRTEVSEVKNQVLIQSTQLINDCEQIAANAVETYMESNGYDEFKKEVKSELELIPGKIELKFTEATEQTKNVNDDLQKVVTKLEKHFVFNDDGLTIKAGTGSMELVLDNDIIRFVKNGREFGWWDGINFHTGNVYVDVDEVAQFGNYGFVPFSDEEEETDGLDLVRVGG